MRRTPPVLLLLGVLAPWLAHGQPPAGARSGGVTPPRLALVDGTASFWRPGGADWTRARVNTPLGTGDALYTEPNASVEAQIGAAAYLRLGATTYAELSDVSPDQLQLKLAGGDMSLDLREPTPRLLEVDTPQAAFMIDRPGYYRLHVDKSGTTLIARRGGGAMMTPGNAASSPVRTGEEAVVTSGGDVHHYAAPDLDAWDRWSTERTDRLLDPLSARYVADGIYGVADLDHAGTWKWVDEFGPVWFPDAVSPGWVPFAVGQWLYDSTFGWTWVDDAPWGWAPFHHGRWVPVDGRWAWAPGPADVVPAYVPATVGWLDGGPGLGWLPLGWGEPIFPWWGPPGAAGVASWAGWGGPWIVNRAPIQQRVTIYAGSMSYANAAVPGAVVAARTDRFGRGDREHLRTMPSDVALMRPREGGPAVSPVAASLAPTSERGPKPASSLTGQRVVATRMPPDAGARLRDLGLKMPGTAVVQLVLPPPRRSPPTGDRPPDAAGGTPAAAPEHDGAGAFAAAGQERREVPPPVAAAPPATPAAPPLVAALTPTTSSTLVVSSTTLAPPSTIVTPATIVTSTTLVSSVAAPPAFQDCTAVGAECGPCASSGEMALCLRQIGKLSPVCVQPSTCIVLSCLWDSDCGAGRRCVQNPQTMQANCCEQCTGAAGGEEAPRFVSLSSTTTTSTMTVAPPTFAPTTTRPTPTTLPTPTTVVTSTTLVSSVAAPPAFQDCTAVGAECGPCASSGEMALCLRQIGKLSPVCAQPSTCIALSCLWDSDCGTGRRCVQNPRTMQANCCDECTEVVRENMPRFVTLATVTTSSTSVVTSTTLVPPPPVTSTTIAPPESPAAVFQHCTAVGAACGPCGPDAVMSRCLRQIGAESAICAEPNSCVAVACLWDRDCGPRRRCVLNPITLKTNCCEECTAPARDDAFDVVTTTTTLPPKATSRRCLAPGDTCGPCAPSGLMTLCQQEIGSARVLCPKPGSCVDVACTRSDDCLPHQRCVFNSVTSRTNCCEACE